MNTWCESCARKNVCYIVYDRPKCFVPITNTASGTPYKIEASFVCRDEPRTDCKRCRHFATDNCRECYGNELFEESGYITELTNTSQTERSNE